MRKLIAPAIGAIATVVLLTAPAAQAKSKYADIRVVTSDGTTLADHRQYTDDVKVKTSVEADCFGESSPSSNSKYSLDSPTLLGALIDASKAEKDLKPLLITDAFFDDFGSFGVCGVGPFVGSSVFGEEYWYSAVNGEGATAGSNQIPVSNGDSNLWYFATGAESAVAELKLKAPVRVEAGEEFTVKVTRVNPDGSKEPAEGASVTGDLAPTNAEGKAQVVLDEGTQDLVAQGTADDVQSAAESVCAAAELSDCPRRRGLAIFGSPGDDQVKGTRGPDTIDCGKGRDVVRRAQRSDEIANSCEKVKRS